MAEYRAFRIKDNQVGIDATIITCDTDSDAIKKAERLVDGNDAELWDGARFVKALSRRMPAMAQKKPLNAATCREQAVNCRETAKSIMSPSHRVMLEHIADTWDRIALDIDKRDK